MNLSELLKFTIYPNSGYNGMEGYDYSRVFDNGVLLKILQSPSKHRPNDLRIIPSEVIDGYWIQRGNEYLIPLIYLYSAEKWWSRMLHHYSISINLFFVGWLCGILQKNSIFDTLFLHDV